MQAQAIEREKNDRLIAALGALLFAIGILLILFFIIIHTPNPPFPEAAGGGGGIELSFGNSADGMGNVNPDQLSGAALPSAPVPAEEQPVLTQDYDMDATAINTPDKKTIPNKTVVPPTQQKDKSPEVNNKALFSKNKGGSQGNTGKPGNLGEPNGNPNALFNGTGKGGKGTGGGDGDGDGPGNGPGKGLGPGGMGTSVSGISRSSTSLPRPTYNSEKQGKVVVNITVDENGKVTSATAGKGTTVTDGALITNAINAAKRSTFKVKAGADDEVGTITYIFVKN